MNNPSTLRNPLTIHDLSKMEPDEFIETVKMWPEGKDWEYSSAFAYAAHRLARMQGLVVKTDKTNEKSCG